MTSINWQGYQCKLQSALTGAFYNKGDHVTINGIEYELLGGNAPHKPSSLGMVELLNLATGCGMRVYPSVIEAKWTVNTAELEAHRVELRRCLRIGSISVEEYATKMLDIEVNELGSNFELADFCRKLLTR